MPRALCPTRAASCISQHRRNSWADPPDVGAESQTAGGVDFWGGSARATMRRAWRRLQSQAPPKQLTRATPAARRRGWQFLLLNRSASLPELPARHLRPRHGAALPVVGFCGYRSARAESWTAPQPALVLSGSKTTTHSPELPNAHPCRNDAPKPTWTAAAMYAGRGHGLGLRVVPASAHAQGNGGD